MPIIGWIRDLFGIQKDMYETKKTRLEILRLEEEVRSKLITPAALEDIEKYDPKIARIKRKIKAEEEYRHGGPISDWKTVWALFRLLVMCVGLIFVVLMILTGLLMIYSFLTLSHPQ